MRDNMPSFAATERGPGPTKRPARVAIVEDDPVLLDNLVRCIADEHQSQPEFIVAGTATTLASGRDLLEQRPDVLLVDLVLPDGDGTELIRKIQAEQLDCRSLVLSILGDVATVVQAVKAGADGYLLKANIQPDEVRHAARIVLGGGSPISPGVARHILRQVQQAAYGSEQSLAFSKARLFSPRELEVLEGLAKGLTYKEVATIQNLSPNTVSEYVKAIYKKLNVNSRSEAVFEALHSGLLSLPPRARGDD